MTSREDDTKGSSLFDDSRYGSPADNNPTNSFAEVDDRDRDDIDERPKNPWHGGLDLGLLILRVAVGGIMAAHGLQKLFGAFNGPGIAGTERMLGGFGYSSTTFLAWITGLTELGGGALLVLGLFTPIGAAAILGVTVNIVYVKYSAGFFVPRGYEYEVMLGAAALALLFTGAGRISLDVNTPWRRKPLPFAIVGLILAAAASVVTILLFR